MADTDSGSWPLVAIMVAEDTSQAARARANELADRLGVPIATTPPEGSVLALSCDDEGLSLIGGGLELRADLADMLPRLAPANLRRELLVRAARIKGAASEGQPLHAVDATAGLGSDSLLLAASGFEVCMFESNPVIAALLEDALRRASFHPNLTDIVRRMHLVVGDSVEALPHVSPTPDVVYLDPMFPERKKSAAVKKKFQLLHRLERPCANQEELLRAALAAHPRKVVVKRPVKGPGLAGVKPSHVIAGKAVRYDCIVPPRS
ncbi:class I SAM-dependent methyltransferase [Collinsella sp. An2]|uniref:class I SAM-dependent methyltransferase n=1 Tax=Collinsella sp. An2 TaxID=1965585 RepID=UPI000B393E26|nr:class I SAM-dependent methyltransferase [Collinsella sp. An2]OUP11150.1 SAM-dependent methyltransferase [Collinsella sp. An2]